MQRTGNIIARANDLAGALDAAHRVGHLRYTTSDGNQGNGVENDAASVSLPDVSQQVAGGAAGADDGNES